MPIVGGFGSLAGLGSLILPSGVMESIATVTVGSGGAGGVTFSNIPTGFQHLQLRMIGRSTEASVHASVYIVMNSDYGANYSWHALDGNGAGPAASSGANAGVCVGLAAFPGANRSASIFGASVADILDWGSTTKNKTVRFFSGYDANGAGNVSLSSSVWRSAALVTSLTVSTNFNLAQHSVIALYGIKAP